MKELMAKLFNELNATRAEEECVVCFIEDVTKLNIPEVTNLIKFYRLTITKGTDFDKLYQNVKLRMVELKKREEEKSKEKQTQLTQNVPITAKPVGTEAKVPKVQ